MALFFGIAFFTLACLMIINIVQHQSRIPPGVFFFLVFAGAWIGQFVGHSVEGTRPSFFKDLQFLLIGPLWLLAALYRRLGISY